MSDNNQGSPTKPYMMGGFFGGGIAGAALGALIGTGGVQVAYGNSLVGALTGILMGLFIGYRMGRSVHTDIPKDSSEKEGMLGSGFSRAFWDLLGSLMVWALIGYSLGRFSDYAFVTKNGWLYGALVGSILVPILYSFTYSSPKRP